MTKIALVQMTGSVDPEANARALEAAVAEAAAGGAAMLFTPEMSNMLDKDRARLMSNVQREADDPVLARVRAAAKAQGIWVALGSVAVASETVGRLANRSIVVDANGDIATRYDKIHLFDVDLPSGERWGESKSYVPGERAAVVDTPAGRLGLSVCYDIRFPRLYDALSEAGADLFAIPSAFTRPTGEAHWHLLNRARAVENTAFVISAAQTGEHEDGRATYGHSLVVDPWGEVLLDMGEEPGVGFADIDLGRVAEIRGSLPSRDARTHIAAI